VFSERRAITPVIATLLLIAITVAAVAGFYIFYNSFIKQSKVSSESPSITLSGPSTGNPGDVIVISLKNSGNVDLTSWELRGPDGRVASDSTATLAVGSQLSFTTVLPSTPPSSGAWTIQAKAWTTGGSIVTDVLGIEPT